MSYLRNWQPDFVIRQSGIAVGIQISYLLTLIFYFSFYGFWQSGQWGIYVSLFALLCISLLRCIKQYQVPPVYLRSVDGIWKLASDDSAWYSSPEYVLDRFQVWPFLVRVKLVPLGAGPFQRFARAKSLLLFPDSLNPHDYRRLKIYLRFGRGVLS